MGQNERFGLELAPINSDEYAKLVARQEEVEATGIAAALALGREEIALEEAIPIIKASQAEWKQLEQAKRLIAEASRAASEQERQSAADAAQAVEESAAEYRALAAAKAQADQADLAHQIELESLAIQHETEMLQHEARQLAATEAAEDSEIASLQRSIAAREASERESAQLAAALAREAAGRGGLTAAEQAELTSLQRSIAAHDAAEAESEQLAAAMLREQNAIFAADGALENFTADCSAAASAQGRLAGAAGAVRGGMGNLQQTIIAGSYAFQDITSTSGDFGAKLNSVTNNLPQLFVGLGGLGIALSVAGTAAVAVYRNWDAISSLWETRNPFPKAANDIAGMKRELDAAKESLEKMEKAGTGNASQIAKYNELRATTARLEKEIADQQERQSRLKKFLESASEEDEGRAKGYQEATKGQGQETLNKIAAAMQKDSEYEIQAAEAQFNRNVDAFNAQKHTDEEKEKYLREESARFIQLRDMLRSQDYDKLARDLNDRLLKGEKTAGEILDRLMDGTGVVFGDLRKRMDAANPHIKAQVDAVIEEIEDWLKAETDAAKKGADAAKKADKVLDEVDRELDAAVADAQKHEVAAAIKQLNADLDEVLKEAQEAHRVNDAEAKRIQQVTGKEAKTQFAEEVATRSQATGIDPDTVAAKLAAQLVSYFARSRAQGGLGATQGGARVAAQQIAGQAGFRLTLPQIAAAAPVPLQARPGQRRPVLRGAALARQRAAESDIDRLAKEALGPKQAPRRRVAQPQAPKGPGVAELAKPIADTQAAVARIETQAAKDRAIIAQLNANARRLNNRASEQAPTALNTGSSVA